MYNKYIRISVSQMYLISTSERILLRIEKKVKDSCIDAIQQGENVVSDRKIGLWTNNGGQGRAHEAGVFS